MNFLAPPFFFKLQIHRHTSACLSKKNCRNLLLALSFLSVRPHWLGRLSSNMMGLGENCNRGPLLKFVYILIFS